MNEEEDLELKTWQLTLIMIIISLFTGWIIESQIINHSQVSCTADITVADELLQRLSRGEMVGHSFIKPELKFGWIDELYNRYAFGPARSVLESTLNPVCIHKK